ncbi:MAG: hypothetical protein PHS46_04020 [Candidatus Omnitrophica bacterium]|nr:hypothetical protein [Candidatus Omnitrophota bacterium]
MKMRNPFPIIVIIASCVIFLYLAINFFKTPSPKNIKSTATNKVAFEDFDFSEYADNGASKKFTIQGKRLGPGARQLGVFQVAAKVIKITDALLTIYENGVPVCRVMAKKAVLSTLSEGKSPIGLIITRIDFLGKVDVVTMDKKTLVCQKLTWDKARNRLYASGDCVLRSLDGIIRADYIDSDIKLREFNSKNDKLKRLRALGRAVM